MEAYTRDDIITSARGWIGTPYHHQASLKGVGTDCLGLLMGVYIEVTGETPKPPPPYTPDWNDSNDREELRDAAQIYLTPQTGELIAGDVILFRLRPEVSAKHCAIVSEDGRMIHAHSGKTVCEVSMGSWWERKIDSVYKFKGV